MKGGGGGALLTVGECEALARRVLELADGVQARVTITSSTSATNEFARGDTHEAYEIAGVELQLELELSGQRQAAGRTDQVDDAGLRTLVREVRALAERQRTARVWDDLAGPMGTPPPGPQLFFEEGLAAMDTAAQAAVFRRAVDATDAAGLIAAGTVAVSAQASAVMNTRGFWRYQPTIFGEFSLTARTKDGTGSGWAWSGYEDWTRVTIDEVITRAIQLGQRSAHPVAVEPGRYTVILEPAAVAELLNPMQNHFTSYWSAQSADEGGTVFSGDAIGTNKLGRQMLDRRLGLVSDPWDPEYPKSTIGRGGQPLGATRWFEHGVLRNLVYEPAYARAKNRAPVPYIGGVRLTAEGPAQTLDEMIASTTRGIWVNRLSGVTPLDLRTLLLTGVTRDGTFLIENGRITKPIKNLRFMSSPFYALNRLEAWGEPVRASHTVVAPRLKLNDFNFTSISDAV